MAFSAVQYKIMPENLDVDLNLILEETKKKIEEREGIFSSSEEQPIAFGLKALVISFAFPEQREVDEIGNEFGKIEGVSSTELLDYRRALG